MLELFLSAGESPRKTKEKGTPYGQEGRQAGVERRRFEHEDQDQQGDREEDPGQQEEEVTQGKRKEQNMTKKPEQPKPSDPILIPPRPPKR